MTSEEIAKFAFCTECKQPLTVIDMRERATARGQVYPGRPDSYVVECETCNCVERFSDAELYFRVVAAIKARIAGEG